MELGVKVIPLRETARLISQFHSSRNRKMAAVQNFEVESTLTPLSV
jgi:hypothetical protein